MSAPFIYISTFRVKEGKLDDLENLYRRVVETVEEHGPQVIAFHGFLNEDGTEMTGIQIHPDAASMDSHMQVLGEHLGEVLAEWPELVEVKQIDYYGTPSASALEMDRQLPVALSVKPRHVGGFTRSSADRT